MREENKDAMTIETIVYVLAVIFGVIAVYIVFFKMGR